MFQQTAHGLNGRIGFGCWCSFHLQIRTNLYRIKPIYTSIVILVFVHRHDPIANVYIIAHSSNAMFPPPFVIVSLPMSNDSLAGFSKIAITTIFSKPVPIAVVYLELFFAIQNFATIVKHLKKTYLLLFWIFQNLALQLQNIIYQCCLVKCGELIF